MTEDYNFSPQTRNSAAGEAVMEPSRQVVQNILNFARCCQNISVGDLKLKIFLN
ncbi:MAG: hypothetical protein K5650_03815 [Bacteroidales bacterium]|nr:hypothetical protein [Bacteroidales bacterium]